MACAWPPKHTATASLGAIRAEAIETRGRSNPTRANALAAEGVGEALEPLAKIQSMLLVACRGIWPAGELLPPSHDQPQKCRNREANDEDCRIRHVEKERSNRFAAERSRELLMFLSRFQFRYSEVFVGGDKPLAESSPGTARCGPN